MRKDLNKLLCEHERVGSSMSFSEYRHVRAYNDRGGEELENLPTRESMKRRYGYNVKEFGENLNPLWGFVRKNAGRPWDKVYSELCSTFNMNSVINQHILQHLNSHVEQNCFEQQGIVYVRNLHGPNRPVKETGYIEYYVHPRTGILLKNPGHANYRTMRRQQAAQAQRDKLKTRRVLGPNLEARRKDDKSLWYICELSPIPPVTKVPVTHLDGTVTEKEVGGYATCKWEGMVYARGNSRRYSYYEFRSHYVSKIKTASHKELKKYKLLA